MSTSSNIQLGKQGEDLVVQHLINNGFIILARNFKIRAGEIDIIARNNDILACVEVKTRTNRYFNTSEVVTYAKQQKILITAQYFMMQNKLHDVTCRFDIALVHQSHTIEYFPAAFSPNNGY